MNKKVLTIVVAVVVIGGGAALAMMQKKSSTPTPQPQTASSTSTPAQPAQSAAVGTSTTKVFTIKATDESADVKMLDVKKGDKVTVMFEVQQNDVYHGGLEFKSDVVSSGPIKPGESKSVTFTADKSFDFTPYWYQSSVKKDYLISVKVS